MSLGNYECFSLNKQQRKIIETLKCLTTANTMIKYAILRYVLKLLFVIKLMSNKTIDQMLDLYPLLMTFYSIDAKLF